VAEPGKRPRIAVVVRRFGMEFGGLEAYAVHLVRELHEAFDIHVFCQEWSSDLPVARTVMPRVKRLPRWLNLLVFTQQCRRLVRGFDLVHSHENSWVGDLHSVHMMPTRYSLYHRRPRWHRRLSVWTSPRLLAYLAMEAMRYRTRPRREIVAVSPLILDQIETAYRRHPHATVIPPGVSAPAREIGRIEALDALGLPHDRRYAILVAHEPVRKGLNVLLAALPLVDAPVDLVVVGGNRETAAHVSEMAAKTRQPLRVHCWPLQRDLSLFYAAADICTFPTSGDSFGMVPLEAMSYGRPVIVSSPEYCGFAHYVTHGVDAIVLEDPNDASALATAIDRLLADDALYASLASNGKRLSLEMGWDKVAACYAQAYRRILAKPV
jgi:UDP-glucose:(heptosyl)LPS alpha-1,3-glucosyltransferase